MPSSGGGDCCFCRRTKHMRSASSLVPCEKTRTIATSSSLSSSATTLRNNKYRCVTAKTNSRCNRVVSGVRPCNACHGSSYRIAGCSTAQSFALTKHSDDMMIEIELIVLCCFYTAFLVFVGSLFLSSNESKKGRARRTNEPHKSSGGAPFPLFRAVEENKRSSQSCQIGSHD
jgi:hypothetical protein